MLLLIKNIKIFENISKGYNKLFISTNISHKNDINNTKNNNITLEKFTDEISNNNSLDNKKKILFLKRLHK